MNTTVRVNGEHDKDITFTTPKNMTIHIMSGLNVDWVIPDRIDGCIITVDKPFNAQFDGYDWTLTVRS